MEGLKKVQEISMLYQNIAEGNSNISGPVYMNQILKLYNPLTAQVRKTIVKLKIQSLDLRSATAKETGKTIQVMAQVL